MLQRIVDLILLPGLCFTGSNSTFSNQYIHHFQPKSLFCTSQGIIENLGIFTTNYVNVNVLNFFMTLDISFHLTFIIKVKSITMNY